MNPECYPQLAPFQRLGRLITCRGILLEAEGPPQGLIGEICQIEDEQGVCLTTGEICGFTADKTLLMVEQTGYLRRGLKVRGHGHRQGVLAGSFLYGRCLDAGGAGVQDFYQHDATFMPLYPTIKINHEARALNTDRLYTGLGIIDVLMPLAYGQRLGIFAGSGVGKSTLAQYCQQHITCDTCIIALIGERGREVQELMQRMTPDLRQKTIVVAACSDASAFRRRQAAFMAMALAEYFCQQQQRVLLIMDSVTRLAMAQREIGLSLGEPPTARGYTPSLFHLLPTLVERAGSFRGAGSITALFTVLMEGDDHQEPVVDTMRGLLDGHLFLSRDLANKRLFPAIDPRHSLSRFTQKLQTPREQQISKTIQHLLQTHEDFQEAVTLGIYHRGQNKMLDQALTHHERLHQLLYTPYEDYQKLLQELEACLS